MRGRQRCISPVVYPDAAAISANVVSFGGRPPDPDVKMNTLNCPRSEASPDRIGYLPVRKAALFGVQSESGVTSCRKRAPCSASRSMLGVLIVLLPKQPTSPIPRSSTKNIRMFGGLADERLIRKTGKIKIDRTDHILFKPRSGRDRSRDPFFFLGSRLGTSRLVRFPLGAWSLEFSFFGDLSL